MKRTTHKVQVAIYQQAKDGKGFCGDSYFYSETESEFICAIADGLGSGKFAKESSQIVIDIIKNNRHDSVKQIIKKCNKQLYGKRGAVLGILKINLNTCVYNFSSIGNINLFIYSPNKKKRRNIPNGGYLAGYERSFNVMEGKLEREMNFIMFSDGVTEEELAQNYLGNANVHEFIETFALTNKEVRQDDTTLIAMRYEN